MNIKGPFKLNTKWQTWRPIIWCEGWFYVLDTSLKDLIVKSWDLAITLLAFKIGHLVFLIVLPVVKGKTKIQGKNYMDSTKLFGLHNECELEDFVDGWRSMIQN